MQTGEQGFGYIFLLVLIAVIGYATANAVQAGHTAHRRLSEQELLHVGQAFEAALYSYTGTRPPPPNGSLSSNVVTKRGPMQLEDLVKDPRDAVKRRHLRKIFPDPVTGKTEWGLIRDQAGRIVGVHSLSREPPLKQTGFDPAHAYFEEAQSYQDWRFGLPVPEILRGRATQ